MTLQARVAAIDDKKLQRKVKAKERQVRKLANSVMAKLPYQIEAGQAGDFAAAKLA